jgi:predicted transcriptional regulator of viral defense system
MKYKNITGFSSKILTEMNERGKSWFTLSDVSSIFPDMTANSIRVGIKRMHDAGLLLRVREGTYYVIPFEQDPEVYLPDWRLLAAPLSGGDHYIGYYSALQIHGLTTQPSLREQIVVNKQRKPSETSINEVRFQFIYHNSKHYFGYGKQWINQHDQALCSDIEKTVLDCLYKPEYAGGITEIAKAIFAARERIDYDLLLDYVSRFGSQAVLKRLGYLLELLRIETPIIVKLKEMRTSSISPLDTEAPQSGKVLSRWNIVQNVEAETVRGAAFT